MLTVIQGWPKYANNPMLITHCEAVTVAPFYSNEIIQFILQMTTWLDLTNEQ